MTVRPLRAADRAAVRSLRAHLAYADPTLVEAALDGPFVGVVADDGTGVVGYAVALPGAAATLSELAVAPGHRRRGHGRALVDAVAARTGAERLLVTTPVENEGARRFYGALGFEPRTTLPGFYDDGTDALRLVRRE